MPEREESTLDVIRHLKRQDPFVPFEIIMTSGDRYRIEDPDAMAIATSQLHYYPRSGLGVHLRLNQISAIEESNGSKKSGKRRAS